MGKEATRSFEKLLKWIQESTERGGGSPDRLFARGHRGNSILVRLEMLKLARLWDHKPGVAEWWERIKARPCYETAVTKWLRPQDIARYAKLTDPWIDVRNLAAEAR
jgi:hypothetical protein